MRAATSIAMLLLAAATTASAAMYVPNGAYCNAAIGMKVLVSGSNFLFRPSSSASSSTLNLYAHEVTQSGNITLNLQSRSSSFSEWRISSALWDAPSKTLQIIASDHWYNTYLPTANLSACGAPSSASNYLPSGVFCSTSANIVASDDLMLLAAPTGVSACGGTYLLSSTSSPFNNYVGSCPASISYLSYSSTTGVLSGRATANDGTGYRYSVAMSQSTCGATMTQLPNSTSWCPVASASLSSFWASSVLVFDNVNMLYSWVPKSGGQECIRLGYYGAQGASVDLFTITDQCGSGFSSVPSPTGLTYSATDKTLVFVDNQGTSVTMSPCTTAADANIPAGWTCGGASAGMIVVGNTFIVRPDVNSNADNNPLTAQCVVAGTFSYSTTSGYATATSMTTTCGAGSSSGSTSGSVSQSSIRIGVSNATTTVKSVWFNMIRNGFLEGYTFASDLCTTSVANITGKSYNVSVPGSGPVGPLVVDNYGYMTLILNGSWATDSWCAVSLFGAQLVARGGRIAFVVNATNAQGGCDIAVVAFDVQISTAGQISMNIGTSYGSALWTTTTAPATNSLDGVYCSSYLSSLTIVGGTYIWREPGAIIAGALWGTGADLWADVEAYTQGSGGVSVLHVGSASGVLTISLNNGGVKVASAAQCTSTSWSIPATASYCASNVFGYDVTFSTALGGYSLILRDPSKATQCVIGGVLSIGASGVTTGQNIMSMTSCPNNLGVWSLSFGTTGLTIALNNGTTTASVVATTGTCAAGTLANGLYCSPNMTLLVPNTGSSGMTYVMLAGEQFSYAVGSWIMSTNYSVNATDSSIHLSTFLPISMNTNSWFTAIGSGTTTTGIWVKTTSNSVLLTQGNCAGATATSPSTWNTVMSTSAAVAEIGNVIPVLVLDYTSFVLYFPNNTKDTTYDCTYMGTYANTNNLISFGGNAAGCPNVNVTSLTATTTGVTVTLNLGNRMPTITLDFAAANCKATGIATSGRHCSASGSDSAVYVCQDLYFIMSLIGGGTGSNGNVIYRSSLTAFGSLTVASATNVTATPSARIYGVSSTGIPLNVFAGAKDLLWSSTAQNDQVNAVAASFCDATLTTPTAVVNSWPANVGTMQYLPVGPYCGTRAVKDDYATLWPYVTTQTIVSLPNNTLFINITAPGNLVACTMLGSIINVRSTGEVTLSFDRSTASNCIFGSPVQAYSQFTTAIWSASENTLTLTGFTFSAKSAPVAFTYSFTGGSCSPRIAAAQLTTTSILTPVNVIQQGTFNGTAPWTVVTLVTVADLFAMTVSTGSNTVATMGGTYTNNSWYTPSNNGGVPLTLKAPSSYITILNASALPSMWKAPTLDFMLNTGSGSGGEFVTVLGYQGQSASIAGAAAGDDSSSDDDGKKKVIIAVIAVIAVAAVVGLAVMIKRGGSNRGTGQTEGESYQQMSSKV